ncbi:selenocysteine lyase/cysteine desulfurase [Microbacteriaceae bacterium SG_E_30_P1]|uniref:Selenocysteine lyase/cysteine desulfurase n=1 Tax=Antiquaquibacter oligotrophicus TaxID=2880260 RepID=A0ABT6KME0_9MICO|nr:aminotransferase class V-fold PLP-dependent enzyme [Antiquaquibacter oligotrophicus]MDH6180339.1 selenocysteine lyase/cysteine desulfurase [Antiquaquibacter oligotrophicus]UDF13917.1 aminotransferase class V-fold PLP-dependent enzyme [Antiquaquibacter oligotrophicus]
MTTESLAEFSEQFSDEPGYLDMAAVGPLGRPARDDESAQSSLLGRARFGTIPSLLEQDARAREAVASLTGFGSDSVVFQPSTTQAMTQAIFGVEGELLLSTNEYPGITVAAERAGGVLGREVRWFTPESGHVTPEALRDELTPDTAAVVVSLVDFRTGYRIDLDAVREVIGDRLLLVDAVQGLGAVDAPWQVADVIAAGGQKWLRAGFGTGFLALSDRALERLEPVLSGFAGIDTDNVDPIVAPPPARVARSFQLTRPDPVAEARLSASIEELVAIGVSSVASAIAENVTRIIDLADEFALPVVSPRDESERAGIVVLEPEDGALTYLAASLHNHGITATTRNGRVRLSPPATADEETFAMLRAALISFGTVAP